MHWLHTEEADPLEYDPAWHWLQLDEADTLENSPGRHWLQTMALAVECVPGRHERQAEDPISVLYKPAPHEGHVSKAAVRPSPELYKPGAQVILEHTASPVPVP